MTSKLLFQILDEFNGKTILVVGDFMLDQYIWGEVERISPEAPVPVVFVSRETTMPGGAGNVAANIAALGGRVFVIGVAGDDQEGRVLFEELQKRGADASGLLRESNRITTQKIRVVARSQHVVRIDKEDIRAIDRKIEAQALQFVTKHLGQCDGVVFSDYAKGVATKQMAEHVIRLARMEKKPIVADIKPANVPYFRNATLLTPNEKEAYEIAKTHDIKQAGKIIQKKLCCNVLITQGPKGMVLFEGAKITHFPARAREVFDVTGAGDTVAACVALALSAGASLKEAAEIANIAAGIVVGKVGTATISPQEIKLYFYNSDDRENQITKRTS